MLPLRPALRLPLLAAALVAANLVHADVPVGVPFTPEQQHTIQQLSASEVHRLTSQIASEAASSVAKTIEGEKQAIEVAKDALEVGRKSVDWWLSNISFWVGGLGLLIAVAGIGIPLWMGRKQKAEWQEKLNVLTQKLVEAEAAQQKTVAAQQRAEQHAQEIETLLNHARDKTSLIPNAETITGQLSVDVLEKLRKEKPPQVVKLIEQAWDAHRREDWKTAKPLWELLSLIESHDANIWFNLGWSARHTTDDWQEIAEYFRRSNLLEPYASTCNNWGNALSQWAEKSVGKAKQQHFAEAASCYAESTRLQPDDAVCYSNWGNALAGLAKALEGEAQQQSFAEACDKYAKAAHFNQNYVDTYHNWAIALRAWARTLEGNERDAKQAEAAAHQQKAEEFERQAG
ncbi:hypothetical protein [Vogesella indigofera]|uniref:hypothetical protein n=1 Tax=Vogesella indigofera TaxID=45465 RepID=UPI00234E8E9E|nr:hypothetical protein [Vogesella indigofera]MDC7697289.1 hypothetical protein [Vogesella indigofera]